MSKRVSSYFFDFGCIIIIFFSGDALNVESDSKLNASLEEKLLPKWKSKKIPKYISATDI